MRPHLAKDEQRYYGVNACLALWKARASDIIRIYLHKDREKDFSEMIKWCAQNRKAYHIVADQDLEKLADTIHHQGICVVAKQFRIFKLHELLQETKKEKLTHILYLDDVQNPHNIGAILRTAAHFGLRYIVGENIPRLSSSANRTSEGGAEFVKLVRTESGISALKELKQNGYTIYTAELQQRAYSLYETRFAPKSVFVFGNEVDGISPTLSAIADYAVRIPGTGNIESLNVSVASSLFLGEAHRQSIQTGTRRIVQK